MTTQEIYQHVIAEFGTPTLLANTLRISRWTVYKWRTRPIPSRYMHDLEYFSRRCLTKQFMRPDLYKNYADKNHF